HRRHAPPAAVAEADRDRAHAALRHVDRLSLPGGYAAPRRPLERRAHPDARHGRRQEPHLVPSRHPGARRRPAARDPSRRPWPDAQREAPFAGAAAHRILQQPGPVMSIRIAINLPVTDVAASTRFFTALGFSPDPRLANEHMEAIVIGDLIYVLLIEEPFFRLVARSGTMLQLLVASRARADELADKAFAAGRRPPRHPPRPHPP